MDTTQRVEIATSRTKTALLLLGSLAFVAMGAWFLVDPEVLARGPFRSPALVVGVGILAVAFFGFTGAFAVRRLFSRAPGLVLDSEGLTDHTSAVAAGFIPWAEIVRVETGEMARQRFLYVVLRDPDAYVRSVPPLRRAVLAQNRTLGLSPVALTSAALDTGFDEMAALVRAYHAAHAPRPA